MLTFNRSCELTRGPLGNFRTTDPFARGGVGYRLVLNETMIRAMIERAKPEDAVNVFLEAMDEAALFPGGEEALAAACAKRAGTIKPARMLKLLQERRNAQQEAKRQAQLAKDGRIVLKAPAQDGEVRKPALAIDAALAGLNSPDAPVRNLNRRLAEIVKVPTPGLHLLTAADANSVGGERKLIEAPPEFTIREMSNERVGVVVEKYIQLEQTTRNGKRGSTAKTRRTGRSSAPTRCAGHGKIEPRSCAPCTRSCAGGQEPRPAKRPG